MARAMPLSNPNVPTGISAFPRGTPSPFIPRSTSLAFHPMEMLYGVGGPDGTGQYPYFTSLVFVTNFICSLLTVRIMGCKFT